MIFLLYSEPCLFTPVDFRVIIAMHIRVKVAKPAFHESIWSSIVTWMKTIIDNIHDEHDAKNITGSFSYSKYALKYHQIGSLNIEFLHNVTSKYSYNICRALYRFWFAEPLRNVCCEMYLTSS